ncbi:uncharacterized protein [Eurosta solidaginis]
MILEEPTVKEISSTAEALLPIIDQPQGQCLLDGVLVMETSVTCEKQMGCRAIQKTGYCCPDYKCDCQKDGITYLNGDKLVDPKNPCTVCYCKGGEILCSSVTCFHRDDCKPKYIPGRCCPEYDNCPVSVQDPSHNVTKLNDSPAPASEISEATTTSTPPAVAPKITIKEITKPIEIRITDDNKAIPIHQMLKPQSTTTISTSRATVIPTISTTESATEAKAAVATDNDLTQTPPATTMNVSSAIPTTATESEHNQSGENTSKAISSTTTSSSTSVSHKANLTTNNNHGTILPVALGINNGESLKLSASVAYPSTERAKVIVVIPHSAEVAPLIDEGGIPAFGAQELQHDASLNDPTKVNIKRENLATTERATGESVNSEEYASPEVIDGKDASEQNGVGLQLQGTFDLEPETSGSNNIYHIILATSGPRYDGTTEGYGEFKAMEGLQHSLDGEIQVAASNQEQSGVLPPPQKSKTTDSAFNLDSTTKTSQAAIANKRNSTAAINSPSTTNGPKLLLPTPSEITKHSTDNGHHMDEEETAMPIEANPAYPSLPEDDFSLRDVNFPLSETDDAVETDVKDEQRSIGGAFDVSKQLNVTEEGSGSGIELFNSSSTATNESLSNDSTTEITSKSAAKVALLTNSAEDLSAETAISNSSDFQLDNFSRIKSNNDTEDTIDSEETQLSNEAGSGESMENEKILEKRREPTTPRPTKRAALEVDIDELGANASGDGKSDPVDDPKLDAESIKADENVEEGIVKQEAGQKEDVLTVNAKPAEERTVEEVPAAVVAATLGRLLKRFV